MQEDVPTNQGTKVHNFRDAQAEFLDGRDSRRHWQAQINDKPRTAPQLRRAERPVRCRLGAAQVREAAEGEATPCAVHRGGEAARGGDAQGGLQSRQVVGRCRLEGLECVSVETIYQYVWGDKRRGGDLHTHLRRKGRKYRKRGAKKDSRGVIRDRVSIDERPKVVDDKSRFGDLEIDLIMGANHRRALLSANDRASGISWIALLEGKDSKALAEKAAEMLIPFKGLLHTITSDNGKEFAEHKAIAKSLAVDYYFAHPYHSWERGANENMNGLIRQYLPKGTSFDSLDDNEIKRIRDKLNNRPRKKLGFLTPIEYFFANFAPELNLSLTQKVAFVT